MDDLVRRSDILTALHSGNIEIYVDSFQDLHYLRLLSREIDKVIKATPSVDAVPVVRCKDCAYVSRFTDGHMECRLLSGLRPVPCTYVTMEEDDFCSYGERRWWEGESNG